ncbi:hypothetical protein BJ508DRAFT_328302 [Ascobolus immersus RN42]|uniref:Uncharacterized protein n=1 Tax=Ascobolus immersus RN42 TaxID=1160509 RepID=A0A3N4HZX6_ASCIM|nr:hypothetical protein BJ508DRAFT_328302 [Ascobolus immersus RN42]
MQNLSDTSSTNNPSEDFHMHTTPPSQPEPLEESEAEKLVKKEAEELEALKNMTDGKAQDCLKGLPATKAEQKAAACLVRAFIGELGCPQGDVRFMGVEDSLGAYVVVHPRSYQRLRYEVAMVETKWWLMQFLREEEEEWELVEKSRGWRVRNIK